MTNPNTSPPLKIEAVHLGDIPVDRDNAGQHIQSVDSFLGLINTHMKEHGNISADDIKTLAGSEPPIITYLLTHSIDDIDLSDEPVAEVQNDERIRKLEREVKQNQNQYNMRRLLLKEWRVMFEIISTGKPDPESDTTVETATA